MPSISLGDLRPEKGRQRRSAVPGSGNAHRESLILRRVPAAGEGEGDGKARPCKAEQESDHMHLQQAGSAQPAPQEGDNGEEHPEQACFFTANPVSQDAHRDAEDRTAEDGDGDHGRFLSI
ncbi:hypothetical protein D3C86_1692940 [compost metagenome]